MSNDLNFEQLPESSDAQSVKDAGVHIGFSLASTEFAEAKAAEGNKKATGASVKFIFKKENITFTALLFSPATKPEDVKFLGDVYEAGVKIRKRTEEEQIKAEFHERFYFYEQLAKAFNAPKEKIDQFKKQINGVAVELLFKTMFEKFLLVFPKEYYAAKKLNFKTMFNNNDSKHTSFLGICKPSQNNVVFAAYVNDASPVLQLNDYEEKNSVRKYKPKDKAPDAANAGPEGAGGWKPAANAEALSDAGPGPAASPAASAGSVEEELF